jgi:hypothetical protein
MDNNNLIKACDRGEQIFFVIWKYCVINKLCLLLTGLNNNTLDKDMGPADTLSKSN